MMEIIKDVEANIHKIPELEQPYFKSKVLQLSKSVVDKKCLHISSIDRNIAQEFQITKKFIKPISIQIKSISIQTPY